MASASKHPGWIKISIDLDPVAHEAVNAFLFDLGCQGLLSDDSLERKIDAFFPGDRDIAEVASRLPPFFRRLASIFPEISRPKWSLNAIEAEDWSQGWRRFFHAERITDRLEIVPAWEQAPEDSGRHVIRMDPGPAFGTGQHATTRMCLEALEQVVYQGPWGLLDAGTGAGILAIYGAMLGASPVEAVDIDPEAIRWARKNMALNEMLPLIRTATGPIAEVEGSFTVITANLTRNVILELLAHFRRLLEPGGRLILSGILAGETGALRVGLSNAGFEESRCFQREEWACLLVRG